MDRRASEIIYDALQHAFQERNVRIHREYGFDIEKGVRRWVDILVEHPEWGLFVIEIKGYGIENIAEVGKKFWTIERGTRPTYEPFERGTALLQGLMHSIERDDKPAQSRLHVLVCLPFVSTQQFSNRQQENEKIQVQSIIFSDELSPQRLREKLRNAPSIQYSAQFHEPKPPRSEKDDYRVFISYRREDSKWVAGRIADRLKREFGDDFVFFDTSDIAGGVRWERQITATLERTSIVLAVISDKWLTIDHPDSGKRRLDDPRDFVKFEIAYALEHELNVMPIVVESVKIPDARHLPRQLRKLPEWNARKVSAQDFDSDMTRVVSDIQDLLHIR